MRPITALAAKEHNIPPTMNAVRPGQTEYSQDTDTSAVANIANDIHASNREAMVPLCTAGDHCSRLPPPLIGTRSMVYLVHDLERIVWDPNTIAPIPVGSPWTRSRIGLGLSVNSNVPLRA